MYIIQKRDVFSFIKGEWKDTEYLTDSYEEAICLKPLDENLPNGGKIEYKITEK